jgi:hypothetical protein
MALYIPRSIFHLALLFYVRPETFGPILVYGLSLNQNGISQYNFVISVLTYIDYKNIYWY